MTLHRWFAIAVVAAELAACSGTDRSVPVGPSFDVMTDPVLSGSVTNATGGSICNTFGDGSTLLVRLISMDRNVITGSRNLVCPNNNYSFPSVTPGRYLIRVQIGVIEALDNG